MKPNLNNFVHTFCFVRLTKNAQIGKYKCFTYGSGLDGKITFSFPSGECGCNLIIFRVEMSSCVHADNKKKDISNLSIPMEGLNGLTLTSEKRYWINFTKTKKKFVYASIIMKKIVIYLLMVQKF